MVEAAPAAYLHRLDAHRVLAQRRAEAEAQQRADRVGRELDARADLGELPGLLVDHVRQAVRGERARQGQTADSRPDDGNPRRPRILVFPEPHVWDHLPRLSNAIGRTMSMCTAPPPGNACHPVP